MSKIKILLFSSLILSVFIVGCDTDTKKTNTESNTSKESGKLQDIIDNHKDGDTIDLSNYNLTSYNGNVNKKLTIKNGPNGKELDIDVSVTDVKLENIEADVAVLDSVGDGDLTITDSKINKLLIQGGGENSIHIGGKSTVQETTINKEDVRLAIDSGEDKPVFENINIEVASCFVDIAKNATVNKVSVDNGVYFDDGDGIDCSKDTLEDIDMKDGILAVRTIDVVYVGEPSTDAPIAKDSNNGLTPKTPVKTFHKAKSLLTNGNGILWVCGSLEPEADNEVWEADPGKSITLRRHESYNLNQSLVSLFKDYNFTLKNITLDGNKRNIEALNEEHSLITCYIGHLTLGEGAVLQNNVDDSGIYLWKGYSEALTLTMEDGAMIMNNQDWGVTLTGGVTFNMKGGIISGNKEGGIMTVDTADRIYISGSPVISGNTTIKENVEIPQNIWLDNRSVYMTITGELTDGASIGFDLAETNAGAMVVKRQAEIDYTPTESDLAKLFCDNKNVSLKFDANKNIVVED